MHAGVTVYQMNYTGYYTADQYVVVLRAAFPYSVRYRTCTQCNRNATVGPHVLHG